MNDLLDIYKRIEYLRNKGVKMKEMADHTNMAASVLSSLYSSVLPTYISTLRKGSTEEESLDYALSQVNNVSKKRLLGSLKELKEQLFELEPAPATGQKANPFLDMLTRRDTPLGAGSVQLQRHLHQLQPLFLLQCLKGGALPDNPCRQQRPRQSGAHERLQHHPLRHCYLQQPPECLYLLQRTRGAPTGLVHHLPATAHVRLSPPAQSSTSVWTTTATP